MPAITNLPAINYSPADDKVWSILFDRQLPSVNQYAYAHFTRGLDILKFSPDLIPDFSETNHNLSQLNGWSIYPVPGLISNTDFFLAMTDKRFGVTSWIRKMEQLDYLEEPDLFHDVFGHVPLLADQRIADFLLGLAGLAKRHIESEAVIEGIARLYWYTIEFGLVREQDDLKIYGAGILSSVAETKFVMSPAAKHQQFDLETILKTPYIKDRFQEQYFVLDSIEQLNSILNELELHFS
jgi:phenylalanine-4-hydroxylase